MNYTINPLIEYQVFEAVIMFYAGMAVMLLLELFSFAKGKMNLKKKAEALLNVIFWIFIALLSISFLYYASYGKVSVHIILAYLTGLFLWRKCFYGII